MYAKAPPSDSNEDYMFQSYLYTHAILRQSLLLFAVWSAKGWGPLAFTTMLQPGPKPVIPPTLATPEGASYIGLERLSRITGVTRSQIATVISLAHGPWLLHLGPRERLAALEAIAGMYSCLGYKRKEAYILRELLGCIMDLLVCGRNESAQTSHARAASAGLGIEGANIPGGSVAIRENELSDGNESLIRLVKYICRVHGVDLEAVKLVKADKPGEDGNMERTEDVDSSTGDDPHEPFGWPELQVGVVREAIAVAEALPGRLQTWLNVSPLTY
jgi:trafficking protein particle complex subunit 9